jgi:hypothetical protein
MSTPGRPKGEYRSAKHEGTLMTTTRHPTHTLRACALAAAGLAALAAQAETSPYYIGATLSVAHDSNLIRVRDGQAVPAGLSASDTTTSAALLAGIDQTWGRQHLSGNATLRENRYARNGGFNSQGYTLNLGLDWQTIERISGKVNVSADRTLRADVRDVNDQFILHTNAENASQLDLSVRVGLVTQLSAEAALLRRDVRYSAREADYREYQQSGGSLGLRWQLGGSTTAGLGLRQTRTDYPRLLVSLPDTRDLRTRNDVDLSATWAPAGASTVDLRVSRGSTSHQQFSDRDFSATTGALTWAWQPTGKLRFNTRAARDTGQDADRATTAYTRTTDTLRLRAAYDLSAKIALNASASRYSRTLVGRGLFVAGVEGRDSGNGFELGLRWAPYRSTIVGCSASHDRLGRNGNPRLNDAYRASGYSCWGQFILQ